MVTKVDYHTYMASREWRLKRKEVMAQTDGWCERCHSAKATQVHHLTYENLGHESLNELQGLCRSCHAFISADSNEDPMLKAMLGIIQQNGLKPDLRGGSSWGDLFRWYAGEAPSGARLFVDFRTPLDKGVGAGKFYCPISLGFDILAVCWWE